MLFTEQRFLLFFAVVFAVHWLLRGNRTRKLWLLLASYAFYAGWDWRFTSLILASTVVDFAVVRMMEREHAPRRRWLVCSVVTNLSLLGFFKYYNFFVESAAEFTSWLGLPMPVSTLEIVLPVGISFYTFQSLSYTIDVYRGGLRPVRSFTDFALFVAFFPQLVAGPIVRAKEFHYQLEDRRRIADVSFRACFTLFLIGYVKKAVISDHIAQVVDPVFAAPGGFMLPDVWLAWALYPFQLYCDFSGYTDMALAAAGLLGYRLVLNFNAPYFAQSIREFWGRWHISLSAWFRDYLYIPLGGSRGTRARTAFNLFTVFVLCGIWHGASLHFLVWGLGHGLFMAMERLVDMRGWWRPLRHAYAMFVTWMLWVLFRAPDLGSAMEFYHRMFGAELGAGLRLAHTILPSWWVLPIAFLVLQALDQRYRLARAVASIPTWRFAAAYGVAVAAIMPWVAIGYRPFAYFQF